jgi:dipeptide/tripeptide permease
MIEKMDASKIFVDELNDDQIQNLAAYFVILPSEVAMKLWTVVGDSDTVENCIKLHKAEVDGLRVSEHLVKILGGAE